MDQEEHHQAAKQDQPLVVVEEHPVLYQHTEPHLMEVLQCQHPKRSLPIEEVHPMDQEEHHQAAKQARPLVVLEERLVHYQLTEAHLMEVLQCQHPKHSLLIEEVHPMDQEEHHQAAKQDQPLVVLEEHPVLYQHTEPHLMEALQCQHPKRSLLPI